MTYQAIQIEKDGAVDWLTLNRPDQLNTLDPIMIDELREYFSKLVHNTSVRIVVLRGAGRAFCAGLDLSVDYNSLESSGAAYNLQRSISDIIVHMRRCPQPIIGLLHGATVGGGFSFALATDIRIATRDVRMNAAFIKIGLTGCDIGVSYHLPRLVGKSVAAEILMTGRFIEAERALQTGLVSKIVDDTKALEEEAQAFCKDMLMTSAIALRLTKTCLDINTDSTSLEAAIALEDRQQSLCASGKDFKEGIKAFLEKRLPDFKEP